MIVQGPHTQLNTINCSNMLCYHLLTFYVNLSLQAKYCFSGLEDYALHNSFARVNTHWDILNIWIFKSFF